MSTYHSKHQGIRALVVAACAMAIAMFLCAAPAWASDQEEMLAEDEPTTAVVDAPAQEADAQDEEGMAEDVVEEGPAPVAEVPVAPAAPVEAEPSDRPVAQEVVQMAPATTVPSSGLSAEATSDAAAVPHVRYIGYVQDMGWLSEYSRDGAAMGTTGRSLRLEAFKIRLSTAGTGLTGDVLYRASVQGTGWQSWRKNGGLGGSGTHGKRIEAIQVKLRGSIASAYDVYYSVYVQGIGWMMWAKNGESAGTGGLNRRVEAMRVQLVPKGGSPHDAGTAIQAQKSFDGGRLITVKAYVSGRGWTGAYGNGDVAGTTGEYLALESLRVSAAGLGLPGRVVMKGYVQDKGWTNWANGKAGTAKSGKRLEAVIIDLRGELAKRYDIYYRAHVGKLGWLKWAKGGQKAGTAKLSNRLEAIQILVVEKGSAAPANTGSARGAFVKPPSVFYRAYVNDTGWQSRVRNGKTAGKVGRRIEAFRATVSGGNLPGNLTYTAYVRGRGWHKMRAMGKGAGTVGENRGIEAIKMQLGGQAAKFYDVWYRVYMPKVGWLGWAKNGAEAGAPGAKRNIQCMQVRLVRKGANAPGPTKYSSVGKGFFQTEVTDRAQGYYSPTGWLILVDTNNCQLHVFRGYQYNWERYDSWVVTCGAPSTPSVKGVYSVEDNKGYVFGHGYSCYYYTGWNGPYLFHSIKYYEGTFDVMDGTLGGHVSAGCVRMPIDRAKWIYDYIPVGTTVVTY